MVVSQRSKVLILDCHHLYLSLNSCCSDKRKRWIVRPMEEEAEPLMQEALVEEEQGVVVVVD
jgi:hypothetical protein